jgi:hypothetical protein
MQARLRDCLLACWRRFLSFLLVSSPPPRADCEWKLRFSFAASAPLLPFISLRADNKKGKGVRDLFGGHQERETHLVSWKQIMARYEMRAVCYKRTREFLEFR